MEKIPLLHAIILGIVQGIAEFLPISSSGHLALIERILQSPAYENNFFDIMVHFGTLIAIVAAFWKDIREVVIEFFKLLAVAFGGKRTLRVPPARRMALLLIIASLPLPVMVLLDTYVEKIKQNIIIIGFALIVTGLLLWLADRMAGGKKNERTALWIDALIVGLLQCVAAVPGLSRSGTTISTGLFRRFERQFAVRFSFLMALPAILGATLYELYKAVKPVADGEALTAPGISLSDLWLPCLVGGTVAAVVGYFSIGLVKKLVSSHKFGNFSYYCFAVGALTIVWVITGL